VALKLDPFPLPIYECIGYSNSFHDINSCHKKCVRTCDLMVIIRLGGGQNKALLCNAMLDTGAVEILLMGRRFKFKMGSSLCKEENR
jgi:hypothetical protein